MVCPPCSRHRPHRDPEAHAVAPATGCTAQAAEAGGNGVAAAIDDKSTTTTCDPRNYSVAKGDGSCHPYSGRREPCSWRVQP